MNLNKRTRKMIIISIVFVIVALYWFYIQKNLYNFVYCVELEHFDRVSAPLRTKYNLLDFLEWLIKSPFTGPIRGCPAWEFNAKY